MVHGYGLIAALSVNVSLRRHKFNGAAVFFRNKDKRSIEKFLEGVLILRNSSLKSILLNRFTSWENITDEGKSSNRE